MEDYNGPEEVDVKCAPNYVNCIGTNKCIHLSQLCNGVYDCSDGYDEGVHCREQRSQKQPHGQLPLVGEFGPEIPGGNSSSVIDSSQRNQDGRKTS
ncbi:hypothetical protein Q9966_015103 [Columba livia]|nr:hypothetical protein Q9966_015103 [Columba livia]